MRVQGDPPEVPRWRCSTWVVPPDSSKVIARSVKWPFFGLEALTSMFDVVVVPMPETTLMPEPAADVALHELQVNDRLPPLASVRMTVAGRTL